MAITVFFSWQADTSTKEGRNLVERALEAAVKRIATDITIEEAVREIEIDRDTKGVPGQPPIVDTIFGKIDNAAIFIPDLTFVGKRLDRRPTPNPNVLIEYGWALKSLTHARIVPLMNIAHGKPTAEAMPFDMRHLRNPILYDCADGADEKTRKLQREALSKALEEAIRTVLNSKEFKGSQLKPPEPLVFPAAEPKDGQGKFRPKGEPIGISDDRFGQNSHDVILTDGPVIWLRVMPTSDSGRRWRSTELQQFVTQVGMVELSPMNSGSLGFNYVRNEDGFGMYAVVNHADMINMTNDVAYVFTTGEIWAIDSYFIDAMTRYNAIPNAEANLCQALERYSEFLLNRLGIKPPYKWIAGMQGIKGRGLFFPAAPGQMRIYPDKAPGSCVADAVIEEGLHTPGQAPAKQSLRPFFLKLFDRCGIPRPQHLDVA